MNVKVENVGPCRRKIEVRVPAENVVSEYEAVVGQFTRYARIPGFRQGRAPAGVIEQRFAAEINEAVRDQLLPRYYHEALRSESITPVAIVDLADVSVTRDEGLRFTATVDVAPAFDLPKYTGIVIKAADTSVSDADVDATMARILDRFARYDDAPGEVAGAEDMLQVDFTATCEGKPLTELGTGLEEIAAATGFWLVLSAEREFLPGFVAGLTGARVGDARTVSVQFPADYRLAPVAGKQAEYSVVVKGLRRKVRPELNEEMLKRLDAESEADLRAKVREMMERDAQQREKERRRGEVASYLLDKTQMDLPQTLVERETLALARRIVHDLSMRGMQRDDIMGSREHIMGSAAKTAEERVKMNLILGRIADAESVVVEATEVEEEIRRIAEGMQAAPEKVRAQLEENDEELEGFRRNLRNEKTLSRLVEQARVK